MVLNQPSANSASWRPHRARRIERAHAARARHSVSTPFTGLVDAGDRDAVVRARPAVAGVDQLRLARRLASEQLDDGCRAHLGLRIGREGRLRHAAGDNGIADARGCWARAWTRTSPGRSDTSRASATPASSAMLPAFCGGMTLATAALCLPKSVTSVMSPTSTEVTLPPPDSAYPFEMVRIKLLPGGLEQPLLGERILGVEQDELRFRLPGLQVVRDQAGALVGAGRAAERIGRRRHDDEAAILHRFQLPPQQ